MESNYNLGDVLGKILHSSAQILSKNLRLSMIIGQLYRPLLTQTYPGNYLSPLGRVHQNSEMLFIHLRNEFIVYISRIFVK